MFIGQSLPSNDIKNAALSHSQHRRWRAHFGVCPRASLKMWNLILSTRCTLNEARNLDPFYYFMALYFLKRYPTNDEMAGRTNRSPKTVRTWVWRFIGLMASLSSDLVSLNWFLGHFLATSACHRSFPNNFEFLSKTNQVKWADRLQNADERLAKTSTDGTDMTICEPHPFSKSWWSHKSNGPALRYELSIAVGCSKIVWVHGPFRAGSWPDVKIFKKGLRQVLHFYGEMTIADGGYKGLENWIQVKGDFSLTEAARRFNTHARARHETVNKRIKIFDCLNQRWRHPLKMHKRTFMAIVCLTNIQMDYEPLFDCA